MPPLVLFMVSLAFLHLCRQAGHPVHADYRSADRPLVFVVDQLASVVAEPGPDDHVVQPVAPAVAQVALVAAAADSGSVDYAVPPAVPAVVVAQVGQAVAVVVGQGDRAVQLVVPAVVELVVPAVVVAAGQGGHAALTVALAVGLVVQDCYSV